MRTRSKTLATVTVGAIALASGAYALGAQEGGGSADAAHAKRAARTAAATDPGIKALAGALGVDPDKLATALNEIRAAQGQNGPKDPRDELATQLADALGVPKADVAAALAKVAPGRGHRERGGPGPGGHGGFAAALAKKLGIDKAKVKAAFDKFRPGPGGPAGPPDFAAVAKELGVSEADLKAALGSLGPRGGRGRGFGGPGGPPPVGPPPAGAPPAGPPPGPGFRGRRGGGPGVPDQIVAALAKELNLDESKVKAAFDQIQAKHQADEQTEHDAFVKALADKLGLTVDQVEKGLGSVPPRGFGGPRHP
ncbi:MAG: hypothetical protein QOJ07_1604 [Thermoleophilaceae bacterium]|nr:hypothetical protein [Thermoleophilaceae bacterium]